MLKENCYVLPLEKVGPCLLKNHLIDCLEDYRYKLLNPYISISPRSVYWICAPNGIILDSSSDYQEANKILESVFVIWEKIKDNDNSRKN